jgi:hypothetical protein
MTEHVNPVLMDVATSPNNRWRSTYVTVLPNDQIAMVVLITNEHPDEGGITVLSLMVDG